MKMSETVKIADQAKKDWVDDNIRRLSSVIHLENQMLVECKLDEVDRVKIKTRIALFENELGRFNGMKREEPQYEL